VTFTPLDYSDLGLAAILIILNAVLFMWLRLKLERQLVIATLRMLVQLSLLGLVLKVLFEHASPIFTGLAALVMILFAGYEVLSRQQRRLAGWWSYGVGTASILFAGTVVTAFALTTQVRPDPWYHPQIALPLLGMVLGNTMTGVALGLDTLTTRVARERVAIEAMLALGATRQAAFRPFVREAMRNGLIPIINAMSAAGLVSNTGHDDRANPLGYRPDRGGQISDPDHVSDRRRHRDRRGLRRPCDRRPALQRSPSSPPRPPQNEITHGG